MIQWTSFPRRRTAGAFAAAAVIGTLAGGRLAGRASPQRLATAFSVLVIAVACYPLAHSLRGLV